MGAWEYRQRQRPSVPQGGCRRRATPALERRGEVIPACLRFNCPFEVGGGLINGICGPQEGPIDPSGPHGLSLGLQTPEAGAEPVPRASADALLWARTWIRSRCARARAAPVRLTTECPRAPWGCP